MKNKDTIYRQAAIDAVCMAGCCSGHCGVSCDEVKAIETLPSAQPEQRWIPVTERSPEYGVEVLTINKDGEYEINHIIDDEDGEWFFDGAIAWMPLQPYKGDEE